MFDGDTYVAERDGERLSSQLDRVRFLMLDEQWRTLGQIMEDLRWTYYEGERDHVSEASISARLRDLRKPKFGSYVVERRYISNGVWEYRVSRPES